MGSCQFHHNRSFPAAGFSFKDCDVVYRKVFYKVQFIHNLKGVCCNTGRNITICNSGVRLKRSLIFFCTARAGIQNCFNRLVAKLGPAVTGNHFCKKGSVSKCIKVIYLIFVKFIGLEKIQAPLAKHLFQSLARCLL